jgi:hypothetical protein
VERLYVRHPHVGQRISDHAHSITVLQQDVHCGIACEDCFDCYNLQKGKIVICLARADFFVKILL